jgi:hypothetical protein
MVIRIRNDLLICFCHRKYYRLQKGVRKAGNTVRGTAGETVPGKDAPV